MKDDMRALTTRVDVPSRVSVAAVSRLTKVSARTLFLCCVAACFLSAAKPGAPKKTGGATSRPAKVAAVGQSGKQLWMKYCALCHGDKGQGYAADHAPALSHQGFLASTTDSFLYAAIATGRAGTPMGGYGHRSGGPLSHRQIRTLVRFIKQWQRRKQLPKRKALPGDAAKGKKQYKARCASCHGKDGRKGTAPSVGHPALINSISDTQLLHAIEKGRPGTPMPAFEKQLKPSEIRDLIAFLRLWRKPHQSAQGRAPVIGAATVVHPRGASPAFVLRKGLYLKAAMLRAALAQKKRVILLDARVTSDYLLFHIPGAIPAPYYNVGKIARALPRDGTWIIAYCACPHRASGKVIDALRKKGFKNTAILDEGILHWKEKRYPLVRGEKPFGPAASF